MTIHAISSDTSTAIVADTSGDMWIVKTGVEVTTTTLYCIDGHGSNGSKTFAIHGHLLADNGNGIFLGEPGDVFSGFNNVEILATGSITSQLAGVASYGGSFSFSNAGTILSSNGSALALGDNDNLVFNSGLMSSGSGSCINASGLRNIITNAGTLQGRTDAVWLSGQDSHFLNTGLITGGGTSINVTGNNNVIVNEGALMSQAFGIYTNATGTIITNSGSITTASPGASYAIYMNSSAGEVNEIANTGLIQSLSFAILGASGTEIAINRGRIIGTVSLSWGNDIFDGIGGEVIGEVLGGAGNDTYRVSDTGHKLVELADEGIDTVESTVSYRLAASFENLVLLGTDDTDATGNGAANVLTGNVGDNRLGGGAGSDSLFGGAGEDRLFGSAGADILRGEDGEDMLLGGADQDILVGGADNDRFVFRLRTDSTVTASDRIADFTRGEDIVDLSAIDARVGGAVNNAFTFIGTAAFSGAAGELRFVAGTTSRLEADTDGNGIADFRILFTNGVNLQALDIIL